MKRFLFSVLCLGFFQASAVGQAGPTIDPSLELIQNEGPHEESDRFCDIGILSRFGGSFENRGVAQNFCSGFDEFCHIRQFGNQFYEVNYRRRVVFRGRGQSHRDARRNAFDLYFDFLDSGRFYYGRFGHQFIFSNDCRS